EVAVDTAQGNVTAISDGSWSIDAADQRIEFVIDLTGTGLANSGDLALRWQMTCANDVIEASVVPLPAAVWLFGSGLVGLAGIARRKKTA
ncbi:MAG TPA: VPLPA-CTERM sorting domain-containing protein, partial [Gammaproteobacteria bacterium]|nr:VPLPA-CTERM sorting domain-containing protein [Gammaproteobacteria bacterium]